MNVAENKMGRINGQRLFFVLLRFNVNEFVIYFFLAKSLFPSFAARMMQSIHILVVLVLGSLIDFSASEPRVVCYYTNWSVYRPVSSATSRHAHV